jgi:hypothetical protein
VDRRDKRHAREEKDRPAAGGSVLRGAAGRGPGGVDAAWRQSGRERGGPGHDSGGRQGRRDAVDATLTGGVGSTVRPIRFSNRIKLISNIFKFAPNFDQFKRCLPVLQKF